MEVLFMNKLVKSIILSCSIVSASYTPQKALIISNGVVNGVAAATALAGGLAPFCAIPYTHYAGTPFSLTLESACRLFYMSLGSTLLSPVGLYSGYTIVQSMLDQFTPHMVFRSLRDEVSGLEHSVFSLHDKKERLLSIREGLQELKDYFKAHNTSCIFYNSSFTTRVLYLDEVKDLFNRVNKMLFLSEVF
jgi:hypothetical protein